MLATQRHQALERDVYSFSDTVRVGDIQTAVHVVRYSQQAFRAQVTAFNEPTILLDWCERKGIQEAVNGGFFLRPTASPLGDTWVNGGRQPSTPFMPPWNAKRGSLHIDTDGRLSLGPRSVFPTEPQGDLLQTGPLLVKEGQSQIKQGREQEGFSAGANQFDDDITVGRFPRTAIGCNDTHIWTLAADGSTANRTGLSFEELADTLLSLGATAALNLDGGGSSTLISNGELLNHPYGDGQFYQRGRALHSAIVFTRR